jgi:hypothetical protein
MTLRRRERRKGPISDIVIIFTQGEAAGAVF